MRDDEPPPNLAPELVERIPEVLAPLQRVWEERGGIKPTVRGVGLALAAYPDRDHVRLALDLEHWALAGAGRTQPRKDWVRQYRAFLERAPVWRDPKPAAQPRVRDPDRFRRLDEQLLRDGTFGGVATSAL